MVQEKTFWKMLVLVYLLAWSGHHVQGAGFVYQSKARMDYVKERIQAQDAYYIEAYKSILSSANKALNADANPVVNKSQTPPSGDKHDYLSIAPYWWPNPSTADGLPWIRKDGQVNPKTRGDHTDMQRLSALFNHVEYLSMAYYFSGEVLYAQKARELIKIWFIDEETKMNPNVNFGQGVPGLYEGREFGIIEFAGIDKLITAVEILDQGGLLDTAYLNAMNNWFSGYVNWLTTSVIGVKEANTKNNHAVWYDFQVVGIQIYLGHTKEAAKRVNEAKFKRVDQQIATDGSLPEELKRTKSVNYCTMNLKAFTLLAELGDAVGVDLFNYQSTDGRGIIKAFEFLKPYAEGTREWTWKQIKGSAEQAIEDKMKPELFGVAKSVYKKDFAASYSEVHLNMSPLYRIKYPYDFNDTTNKNSSPAIE